MRPPERIDEILELIGKIWKQNPDMRFLQLVYVLQSYFSQSNNGRGKIEFTEDDGLKKVGFDLFNTEDSEFGEFLKLYFERK